MNLNEQISRIKQVMCLKESSDDKLRSALFAYFDFYTKNASIYFNPDTESIWMIFPEEKIWVFELENDGDLWYNYNFFDGVFKYLTLDVTENQYYITKWVEDTLKKGVRYTQNPGYKKPDCVEDTLKNGVKDTVMRGSYLPVAVKDTLKKGKKLNNDESE